MADSSLNTAPPVRRKIVYLALVVLSVVLTSELSVVGACLALIFLCLAAPDMPARGVLGVGLMALGGLQAVSLFADDGMAAGLPVLAAGLVPAIMLAPRSVKPPVVQIQAAPDALEAELSAAMDKLELLRATPLDVHQARYADEAFTSCSAVRDALERNEAPSATVI